ncbi:glycosyl transferase [Pseudoclavibacter endophyticus]|uniref:Glycosyltransferase family 9 protein n=1 Tax=Pseudoclavibacter endophyticus TaxID=1778590 RepID=A0A6H9WTS3_9MICO|nr:glycosyltransferase family 9 protein [Pseudoclavibacter endophyticus]KAB1650307.1 glycosyltransferase family 9 protein [Pseudoclavibacter endophyticus]GGA55261.1 glycosyl transferase [Pseudoclavibacter endophyticus]
MTRILAVRLDSDGDVLLTGPAIRALSRIGTVDLLASPSGAAAARLLPGVDAVLEFDAPWSGLRPPSVDTRAVHSLIERLRDGGYDQAVIFTSFHQSPLPVALLARMAGIPHVVGTSVDYPGSLLDVRLKRSDPPGGGHEVEAALEAAVAAGAPRPDRPRLDVRRPLPPLPDRVPVEVRSRGYVVLHPGASVPARGLRAEHAGSLASALAAAGHAVVLTGGSSERELVAATVERARRECPDATVLDLAGSTDLAGLAAVLEAADCTVVGNTGPAHLSAAVGTPVVSLFSPVVPAERWRPYGVPVRLLGDQGAPCRDSRARECPVPGHPCLSEISGAAVVAAVAELAGRTVAARSTDDDVVRHLHTPGGDR